MGDPRLAAAALVTILVSLLGLLSTGTPLGSPAPVVAAPTDPAVADVDAKPNVILFLTDDQTLSDMRALGAVKRRIGGLGTTFSHAFSSFPQCCPARATLLTGQYAHNHGVMGNTPPHGGFQAFDDDETLAVWLTRAGYNTLMLSKYLNGYDAPATRTIVPPGWAEWQVPVLGIYNYRSFTMNENGTLLHYSRNPVDHVRDRGIELIQRYAAQEKPFFLQAGFVAPHTGGPVEPDDPIAVDGPDALKTPGVAPEFRNHFRRLPLPHKPSILEPNMSDKPSMTAVWNRPRWEFREAHQQRLESLLSVDKAVNSMMDALEATGEAQNTLVIFTSDNGHLVGEHRGFGKVVGYEESVRVPLIISGPGFSSGVRRNQLVSLADLASTIAQATGAVPTLLQDGQPLQDLSRDPDFAGDRSILLEAGPSRRTGGQRLYTGIRTPDGRSLLVWYTGAVEYYDLHEDPFQVDGRVSGTETVEGRDDLVARLDALKDCAGTTCR
jgi:N-acetylglucosamine-6-sulfatase